MKDYIQIGIEKSVRDTAMLYFGGSAGQQCVPASYLENFDLPLPPKEKQLGIARLKPRPCRKKGDTYLKKPSRK